MSKLNILDGIEVHGNVESNHIYAETYRTSRSDGDIYIQAASASDFVSIGTEGGNNNLLTVLGGGNVGIGTASPNRPLHIIGQFAIENAVSATGSLLFSVDGSSNKIYSRTSNNVNSSHPLDILQNSAVAMRIDSSGRVGIGTTSPSESLEVDGSLNSTHQSNNFNLGEKRTFIDCYQAGGLSRIGAVSGSSTDPLDLAFYTSSNGSVGGTERMRITSAGDLQFLDSVSLNPASDKDKTLDFGIDGKTWSNITIDANNFYFKRDGSIKAAYDLANNRFGINTTIPHYALHVKGTGDFQALKLQGGGSANQYTELGFLPSTSDATNANIYIRGHRGSDGAFANNYLTFGTNNTERLRLDSSGRLGIGTDSPDENLHIKDNSGANIILNSNTGAENNGIYMTEGGDSTPLQNGAYFYYDSSANAVKLDTGTSTLSNRITVLRDSGNVGIGTSSPDTALNVRGDLLVEDSAGTRYIRIDAPKPGNSYVGRIGTTSGHDLVILSANTERMRIDSSGNVGIGTSSPDTPIDVSSEQSTIASFRATGGVSNNVRLEIGSGGGRTILKSFVDTTDAAASMTFQTGSTERMRITSGGNVGIGTSPNAVNKLEVNGQTRVVGGLMVGDSSTSNTVASGVQVHLKNTGAAKLRLEDSDSANLAFDLVVNDGSGFSIVETVGGDSGDDTRFFIEETTGDIGIGTTSPAAKLHVEPDSNGKITKFGNDVMTQYVMTGNSNHTLTLTCGSYYQSEVIITAHQTNGGNYNNLYIRGIWHNNHESHHWEEIENIGLLAGSSFTITVSQNTTSNSGKLVIQHNYSSGSFDKAIIRVTDFYNTHSYTLT